MVESSSAKEEDGEFKHKEANEEVISIHPGDSFFFTQYRGTQENIVHGTWCCHTPCSSHRQ
jgi:hypothetical protein